MSLHYLEKDGDAINCFDKAIRLEPQHDGAWYNKGVLFEELGKNKEAILCFDTSIKLEERR